MAKHPNSVARTDPLDGRQLGSLNVNFAVEDVEQLAKDMRLRLDQRGRTILPGESVSSSIPWTAHDDTVRNAATAPMNWEEVEARYASVDASVRKLFYSGPHKFIDEQMGENRGKDEFRSVRTFSWPGQDGNGPSAITVIGAAKYSARSTRLAARAVYEAEPTALLLQLCQERLGRYLVMPEEHLAAVANYARSFAATNPHGARPKEYLVDAIVGDVLSVQEWRGDLAYAAALDEFAQLPRSENDLPKVVGLGDVRWSRLELLRRQHGNESLTQRPTVSMRGKQLVRGLISLATLGHRSIVGVVDSEILASVTTWLEEAGARLVAVSDTSDIETGRQSIAEDIRMAKEGRQRDAEDASAAPFVLGFGKSSLGSFINEDGLEMLMRRKQRLLKLTRVKDLIAHCEVEKGWTVAEVLTREGPTPGPAALLGPKKGFRFEMGRLEIPDTYLKDVGMEAYAPDLWQTMRSQNLALDCKEASELLWWAAGGAEAEGFTRSEGEEDETETAWTSSEQPVW